MGGRGSKSGGMGGGRGSQAKYNDSNNVRRFLQDQLDQYGLGISKNELADKIYTAAKMDGMNVTILNSKYLTVSNDNGSADFSFTKSTKDNKWILTPMLGYGEVTRGRHNGYTMYKVGDNWFSNKTNAEWAAVARKLG